MEEQDVLALKKEVCFSHNKEVAETETSVEDRIKAAKQRAQNRGQRETPSPTSISEMEVGFGKGRATREIELIWWPYLYSSVEFGKLTVRFYIHKATIAKM